MASNLSSGLASGPERCTVAGGEFEVLRAGFARHLATRPLAWRSVQTYSERVADYLTWLSTRASDHPDALTDPVARDHAVLAYREHLLNERGAAVRTVNLALPAIDVFYESLELGPASVARVRRPPEARKSLDSNEQRRLLRATTERPVRGPDDITRRARDRLLIDLPLHYGLSESELTGLDITDLTVTARSGHLLVTGSQGRTRRVTLAPSTRLLAEEWCGHRCQWLGSVRRRALFVGKSNPSGHRFPRLSRRAVDQIIRAIGREAGLEISPSTLRNTAHVRMVQCGFDPAIVAQLMGMMHPQPTHVRTLPAPDPAVVSAVVESLVGPTEATSPQLPTWKGQPEQLSFDL
ncbi:site-specific integrase [Nocardia brasiliensis]|uniref:site-specific integrase n=1 Tax=Nocardia brasiliensis TaxID=37326 RepID=UPI003D90C4C3